VCVARTRPFIKLNHNIPRLALAKGDQRWLPKTKQTLMHLRDVRTYTNVVRRQDCEKTIETLIVVYGTNDEDVE
jgi:putative ribosome biogenesis GTPase RsgA